MKFSVMVPLTILALSSARQALQNSGSPVIIFLDRIRTLDGLMITKLNLSAKNIEIQLNLNRADLSSVLLRTCPCLYFYSRTILPTRSVHLMVSTGVHHRTQATFTLNLTNVSAYRR